MRIVVVFSSSNPVTAEYDAVWRCCWQRIHPEAIVPAEELSFQGSSWAMYVFDGTCPSYFDELNGVWRFDQIEQTIQRVLRDLVEHPQRCICLLHSDWPQDICSFKQCVSGSNIWTCWGYSGAQGEGSLYSDYILPFQQTSYIEKDFDRLWEYLSSPHASPVEGSTVPCDHRRVIDGIAHGYNKAIVRITLKMSEAETKKTNDAAKGLLRYIVSLEIPHLQARFGNTYSPRLYQPLGHKKFQTAPQELARLAKSLEAALTSGSDRELALSSCRTFLEWLRSQRQELEATLEEAP